MAFTNLTPSLTSFVGRIKELADIKALLEKTRLLTLTGVGGCGKTRLAEQLVTELLTTESYPDGIWWIELVGLSTLVLVPQVVAQIIGLAEAPDASTLTDSLRNYFVNKDVLFVLDNCEHLLSACGLLAKSLLPYCPNLKILATSREPLGVAGEISWLVPSLPLPDTVHASPDNHLSQSHLIQYDAIRLFLERASSILPTFRLTNENAEAVALICQRLDGLPLAIELAAARINVLTVQQIADRLDHRFTLLTAGNRTALIPRHQTLRATMDWSYDLLSEQEQILFRRLSVFAGGFTLEAAEAICADDRIQPKDVLNLLSHLIDKSLVMVDTQRSDVAYYRLLETIRQYALERLQESGEERVMRNQHCNWFLGLAERAEPSLHGPQQMIWLQRLELEHDNFRKALTWSLTESHTRNSLSEDTEEVGLRLAGALFWFWNLRGYLSEGRYWLEKALEESDELNNSAAKAKALYATAELAHLQGDHVTELNRHEQSVALWRGLISRFETSKSELGEDPQVLFQMKKGLVLALRGLGGVIFSHHGDHQTGKSLLNESIQISKSIKAKWELGNALSFMGQINLYEGDRATARIQLEECVRIFRELGDQWGLGLALHWRASVALAEAEYTFARKQLEEALEIFHKLGDRWNVALVMNRLGEVARSQGADTDALKFYEQTAVIHRELGSKWGLSFSLHNLGYIALHQGNYDRAVELFHEALEFNLERKDLLGTASCLAGLAGVAVGSGDPNSAAQLFGKAQVLLEEIGMVLASTDLLEFERNLKAARASLSSASFEQAWETGLALTLDQAVEKATKLALSPTVFLPVSRVPKRLPELLNERELEILHLIAQGFSNHEIAEKLILAVSTVKWNINNLFGKLHVHSRTRAVARARELTLL